MLVSINTWFIPALANRSVGSSKGMVDDECTYKCSFSLKKSINNFLISSAFRLVSMIWSLKQQNLYHVIIYLYNTVIYSCFILIKSSNGYLLTQCTHPIKELEAWITHQRWFSNKQLLFQIKFFMPTILALGLWFLVFPLFFVKSKDPWDMANTNPRAIIWAILVEVD